MRDGYQSQTYKIVTLQHPNSPQEEPRASDLEMHSLSESIRNYKGWKRQLFFTPTQQDGEKISYQNFLRITKEIVDAWPDWKKACLGIPNGNSHRTHRHAG